VSGFTENTLPRIFPHIKSVELLVEIQKTFIRNCGILEYQHEAGAKPFKRMLGGESENNHLGLGLGTQNEQKRKCVKPQRGEKGFVVKRIQCLGAQEKKVQTGKVGLLQRDNVCTILTNGNFLLGMFMRGMDISVNGAVQDSTERTSFMLTILKRGQQTQVYGKNQAT
jgi:hypothetical protein